MRNFQAFSLKVARGFVLLFLFLAFFHLFGKAAMDMFLRDDVMVKTSTPYMEAIQSPGVTVCLDQVRSDSTRELKAPALNVEDYI